MSSFARLVWTSRGVSADARNAIAQLRKQSRRRGVARRFHATDFSPLSHHFADRDERVCA
jgi:hypothetical protein